MGAVAAVVALGTAVAREGFEASAVVAAGPAAAVAVAGVVAAEAAVAHAGRRDSSAVAAFEGFADRRVCFHPSCCRQRAVVVPGPAEAGFASWLPIVGLEDLHRAHLVGRLEDAHLVVVAHLPGLADRWSADP